MVDILVSLPVVNDNRFLRLFVIESGFVVENGFPFPVKALDMDAMKPQPVFEIFSGFLSVLCSLQSAALKAALDLIGIMSCTFLTTPLRGRSGGRR